MGGTKGLDPALVSKKTKASFFLKNCEGSYEGGMAIRLDTLEATKSRTSL